jgi:hypothetical protein
MSPRVQVTRPFRAALLLIALTACENKSAPTPPPDEQTPPPETGGQQTVSGIVREYDDSGQSRPIANLRLKVRKQGPHDGAVGSIAMDDVVTDGEGRYTIAVQSTVILFFQTDAASEYRFLCDAYPVVVYVSQGRSPLSAVPDLPVVHRSWSGNRPPQPWLIGTSVWGVVSARTDHGMEPVAGATVQLDTGLPDPPATTTASGFYMVCSVVGTDQTRTITASKDGYGPFTREIFGGWDSQVHLELTRR